MKSTNELIDGRMATLRSTATKDIGSGGAIAADVYTKLLLKFDDNFTDFSGYNRTITNNGSCGFSSNAKFTKSLSLASSSSYLSIPSKHSFNLLDEDFTIEFFANFLSLPVSNNAAYFFYKDGQSANREYACYYSFFSGAHRLIFLYTPAGSLVQAITTITAPTTNIWQHYCFERKNGTLKIYIDGIQQGSDATVPLIVPTNQTVTIGNRTPTAGTFTDFLMDELKVSVEVARYNGAVSFTPPSSPF